MIHGVPRLFGGLMDSQYNYDQWYEDNYPRMTGHGLWLRGQEMNTLPREAYDTRPFRVLFARLSTYEDVATSFTHQLLYQIASEMPNVFPDLAYLPPPSDMDLFLEHKVPLLLGTNTKFGPERFSLIAFSLSIIQELLNIPAFLKTSGIPLSRAERLERPDVPLIILGGASAAYTSLFWEEGEFADGVFIGGEAGAIRQILEICTAGCTEKTEKKEILARLEAVPGFYTSGRPTTAVRAGTQRGETAVLGHAFVPYNEEELGSGYLQLSEGCRALCSFCAENWMHKPYLERAAADIVEQALVMKAEMGLESVDFFSFNFNMYSGFYPLFETCSRLFQKIYLKSQRFDMLAQDRAMAQYQAASGKSVFSCGLEGISGRLRKYLNKNLDDEALIVSIDLLFNLQARELKIFVLSTGEENAADLAEFDGLLKKIYERKRRQHARTRVVVSITPLVKFPWTPLEFDDAALPEAHEKSMKKISRVARVHHCEAREAMDTNEYLISQVLARAYDPRIKHALLSALEETQFIYSKTVPYFFYATFIRHLEALQCTVQGSLKGFSLEASRRKPWAVIETGIQRERLREIFEKNRVYEEVGAGFGERLIAKPGFTVEQYSAALAQKSKDERRKDLAVTLSGRAAGLPRKYFGLVLASAFMKADRALTPYFRSYAGSHAENCWHAVRSLSGDDIISLSWDMRALPLVDTLLNDPAALARINTYLGTWGKIHGEADPARVSFSFTFLSSYAFDPTTYCKIRGLKHVLKKNEAGCYALQFTPEALKKKIIMAATYTVPAGAQNWSVAVTPGEKFEIEIFMQEAFNLPAKDDWVRVQAIARS
jgi:radical SAM superfamily enzyme YgiQ (UPF0313 family)